MSSKVCIKLCANIYSGWLASSILHHKEQLGDNLYDMAGLEHKVPLPLDCL